MATSSERVKLLHKGFMKFHEEGKTIPEIAEHFNLSTRTIYQHLQRIADENGVTRESLLKVVHKPHEVQNPRSSSNHSQITADEIRGDFAQLLADADKVITNIEKIINTIEEEH